MLSLYITVLLLFVHHGESAMKATAVLYRDGSNTSHGVLTFVQNNASTPVIISGTLSKLNTTTAHGFHVHTNSVSETIPNCTAAGGHFNPYNTTHGPRTANITSRHVGDLGNLTTNADGTVEIYIEDFIIQLYNITQSIINRTIIVHRNRDDGGLGGNADSNTTGNAGARILCGLIKLSSDESIAPTATSSLNTVAATSVVISSTVATSSFSTVAATSATISRSITTASTLIGLQFTTATPKLNVTSSSVRLNIKHNLSALCIAMIFSHIFFY